ncbi:hypothetical protein HHI36_002135 [Cryptolaemus montrouzieri]|uniref:Uncharacterized protein n=1 Tax=Cryptolaemus montrouzieri TaxID=559131 RepID=A0ABD2P9R0_9CUCU
MKLFLKVSQPRAVSESAKRLLGDETNNASQVLLCVELGLSRDLRASVLLARHPEPDNVHLLQHQVDEIQNIDHKKVFAVISSENEIIQFKMAVQSGDQRGIMDNPDAVDVVEFDQ